jgi:hypothetical protein
MVIALSEKTFEVFEAGPGRAEKYRIGKLLRFSKPARVGPRNIE